MSKNCALAGQIKLKNSHVSHRCGGFRITGGLYLAAAGVRHLNVDNDKKSIYLIFKDRLLHTTARLNILKWTQLVSLYRQILKLRLRLMI